MHIHNTASYFLENYEPTVEFLESYYAKFPEQFEEYFTYHLANPDEKKKLALANYPEGMASIQVISDKLPARARAIVDNYEESYHHTFLQDVHVIVGAYGSNAYTHRQIVPDITFCIEKLQADDITIDTIIAHEFGHALHNALSDKAGIEWSKVNWTGPYTMLLQEGVATYLSMQVVDAPESVYFSYHLEGDEWLAFAKEHEAEIAAAFLKDIHTLSTNELFHEWFSIRGGTRFGHTRFAYYLGFRIVETLMATRDEIAVITLWKENEFEKMIEEALQELAGE
ncbi:hypothetical protein ACFO0S_08325 [Chryseomicrobium palamuruense]|uniref:Aminopeptidase n=1 Tax=Chryseomicrobium palamuruense TaxID=682973 RepID=A0ABV8UV46_9BACL